MTDCVTQYRWQLVNVSYKVVKLKPDDTLLLGAMATDIPRRDFWC